MKQIILKILSVLNFAVLILVLVYFARLIRLIQDLMTFGYDRIEGNLHALGFSMILWQIWVVVAIFVISILLWKKMPTWRIFNKTALIISIINLVIAVMLIIGFFLSEPTIYR